MEVSSDSDPRAVFFLDSCNFNVCGVFFSMIYMVVVHGCRARQSRPRL